MAEDAAEQAGDAAALILDLCRQIHGLPRHLGQHSGGMVVMGPPLAERVPVEPTAMPGRLAKNSIPKLPVGLPMPSFPPIFRLPAKLSAKCFISSKTA